MGGGSRPFVDGVGITTLTPGSNNNDTTSVSYRWGGGVGTGVFFLLFSGSQEEQKVATPDFFFHRFNSHRADC